MEKNSKNINKKDLNEILSMSKKILKVMYFFLIVIGAYALLKIVKELEIFNIVLVILSILAPLFIGILVAWLLNPFIRWLSKKGMRRSIGVTLSYIVLIFFIYLILSSLLPLLYNQITEFVSNLPKIFDSIKLWIDGLFDKLDNIQNIDIENTKNTIFSNIEKFSNSLYVSLPSKVITFMTSLISGIGTFIVGLLIGYFLLMSSEKADEIALEFVPTKYKKFSVDFFKKINRFLRSYVNGALLDAFLVFVICSIVFAIIGLQSPILFGLFCGITNVIPYVGPYIGGSPAVLVAFTQSPATGIAILISIVIIQFIEGNILQTLIMSKTTKLHPVTIIMGLLVFGHFFGIVGMLLSTPIIGIFKVSFQYFDKKYNLLNSTEGVNDEKIDEQES